MKKTLPEEPTEEELVKELQAFQIRHTRESFLENYRVSRFEAFLSYFYGITFAIIVAIALIQLILSFFGINFLFEERKKPQEQTISQEQTTPLIPKTDSISKAEPKEKTDFEKLLERFQE